MKKNNAPSPRLFLKLLAATAALFLAGAAQAVNITKTVLNDGTTFGVGKISAAVGPDGKTHVVAHGATVASTFSDNARDIYYWRIAGDGTVEVNALQVNTTPGHLGQPEIKVNGANQAIVVWKDNAQHVFYAVVGTGGTVTRAQADVFTDLTRGIPKLVLSSTGVAHVVKTSYSGTWHRAFNIADNTDVVAEHTVATLTCDTYSRQATAIDSNGNLHTICADGAAGNQPLVYWMLNGATGAVLIDKTTINDLGNKAAHFSMMVSGGTLLDIVYGDKRNTLDAGSYGNYSSLGGTAIYTRLNPYLAARDGTATTASAIRVGSEVELANAWYGQAFMGDDNLIHFLSGVAGTSSSHTYTNRNITHVAVTPGSGGKSEQTISAFMNSQTQYKTYAAGAGHFAFWPEVVANAVLATGYTYQLIMAKTSDLPTGGGTTVTNDSKNFWGCSLNSGNGPVDPLLPLLAALAGVFVMRRRDRARV